MATYVLIHGAWHSGELLEDTAAPIRAQGHVVHTPTLAGNGPGDAKTVGLDDAIESAVAYVEAEALSEIILVGHSYGGMIITGMADRLQDRIRRLVYVNAFVPNDGEALVDMVPPLYADLFAQIGAMRDDQAVVLPYPVWRQTFINDADELLAQSAYDRLNPQPIRTLSDQIRLTTNPADMAVAKSFVNLTEDIVLPEDMAWHPRLSAKLGQFDLVQAPGSHELCFSDPDKLATMIIEAGFD